MVLLLSCQTGGARQGSPMRSHCRGWPACTGRSGVVLQLDGLCSPFAFAPPQQCSNLGVQARAGLPCYCACWVGCARGSAWCWWRPLLQLRRRRLTRIDGCCSCRRRALLQLLLRRRGRRRSGSGCCQRLVGRVAGSRPSVLALALQQEGALHRQVFIVCRTAGMQVAVRVLGGLAVVRPQLLCHAATPSGHQRLCAGRGTAARGGQRRRTHVPQLRTWRPRKHQLGRPRPRLDRPTAPARPAPAGRLAPRLRLRGRRAGAVINHNDAVTVRGSGRQP